MSALPSGTPPTPAQLVVASHAQGVRGPQVRDGLRTPAEPVVASHAEAGQRPQVREVGAAAAAGERWRVVCAYDWLIPGRGVAAVVGRHTVAVFRLDSGEVHAVDDVDPFSGACVLSRGLLGDVDGEPTVASPVYKQRFALRTGQCLDDETVAVRTWPIRIEDGRVEVGEP